MKVSIHQPAYLPYLGYIEKMKSSDVFVILDTVSLSKNSFDNRNRIPINKKDHWLTIPFNKSGLSHKTHLDIYPSDWKWLKVHPSNIQQTYSSSPYFDKYFPGLKDAYDAVSELSIMDVKNFDGRGTSLATICYAMLGFFEEAFETKCKIVRASQHHFEGKGSSLNLNICKELGATEYYSGIMGKDYLDEQSFADAGIKVTYQEYKPPHMYSSIHQLFTQGAVL